MKVYFEGAKDILELRRRYAAYCRQYSYDKELYQKITAQYREALKAMK